MVMLVVPGNEWDKQQLNILSMKLMCCRQKKMAKRKDLSDFDKCEWVRASVLVGCSQSAVGRLSRNPIEELKS